MIFVETSGRNATTFCSRVLNNRSVTFKSRCSNKNYIHQQLDDMTAPVNHINNRKIFEHDILSSDSVTKSAPQEPLVF